ncbi:PREDICTED: breast cancer type 2 susceptibility protein isoform X2 [Cyprinodon variegatus]|uniref:breast cancer type 2 susceptibility protein isoform X2 n=1 Tax=Cyprinodon variegatus TaxID=28743 RepID=UPI0007426988|nr:PREDICTED: breast cancer type 2 susceptibility protein isoform X2 [Cyprinodon variegatus]
MDSSIKNMFDAFKDDIWKELGPVDPNWFEVLTAQASLGEGHVDDNDDLCANQEGLFKAPLEKTAVESQLFSTPKVFRRSQMVSPETEDEPSFTAAQGKETPPWVTTQSPCLFEPTKQRVLDVKCEGVQPQGEESFDLLDTPKKSPDSYVKHISESLGAQINPDISWTSSFNTPPAMPSTLILSKTEESPCPASVTADRNVVLVRKLFPSLSNSSLKTPKKSVGSSNSEGVVFPVAQHLPDSPLDQSGSHWQQKDPDTVKGEVSGAVGLKNASSDFHFFANSSSALRKVKPDRVKCKQITLTNEDACSHQAVSEADNGASSEEATTDLESGGLPATPLVKTGDSQWSPINLSEISSCAVSSSMTQPGDIDSVQHSRPSLKVTDTGFIRKRRQFVYTVATKTSQIKCHDSQSQKMDSSTKISEYAQKATLKTLKNTTGKVECQKIQQCLGEPATYSAVPKLQDVDMSQLCREFAKEFSQMTDLHIAEDAQSNFSPAACLTALKQAKQKVNQANPPNDISANKQVPTVYQPCSVSEGTMIDSRVQSAVKDVTHMTTLSFGPPRSENFNQSRPSLSFKTDMHHLPSSNESGNPTINAEVSLHISTKDKNLDTGKGIDLHTESTSAGHSRSREETVDESNCSQLEKASIVPFANASGFKTASNKGIHISPANLERGKRFFEEADGEKTSHDLSITTPYAKNNKRNLIPETTKPKPSNSNLLPKVERPFVNINSHLTASEKADVTELCCLLEEADSQFEFTQFKPAKNLPNREYDFHTSPRQDKDLDPAFLQDIDFDDSFSSDCGKHPGVTVMNDNMALALSNGETAKGINLYTDLSMSNSLRENSCLSENISETGKCPKLSDIFPRAEDTKASELKSNSTLMHGQGFKTAGGVMLQVSKKSLSRARALFAELENNLTEQKRADKQESKNVAQTEQKCDVDSDICKHNSFILKESCDVSNKSENCFSNLDEVRCSNKNPSSVEDKNVLESSETDAAKCEIGKGISISAKHMKGADVLFKDCQVIEHKEEKSTKAPPESVERGRSFSNFKSPKVNIYKEGFAGCSKFENENSALIAHTGGLHRDEVERNSMSTPALKNENGKKPFSTSKPSAILGTSKSIDLSASKDLCTSDGFRTAAGKNISVSVAAMRNAASLLNQIDTPVETNKQPNQKKKTSETECLSNVMSKIDNGGFETVVEVRKFATLKKPTLSKEHEKSEDKIGANQSKIPGNDPRSGGFFAASDEPGFLSSEALEKEKALFSDSSLNMDDVSETVAVRIEKPETRLCSYTTAGGTKDQVSQKNLPKPKDQFEELDDLDLTKAVDEEGLFSVFDEGNVRGSKQAELYNCYPGDKKKINISIKAGCSRGAEKQVEVKENILPQASHGLQAASGRKAGVSSHSLKRVESLCSEFEEIKNKTNATTPQFEATAPPLKNSGFHSVSGKPMAPSAEEVEKPKSLFGNITRRAEVPDVSQTRKTADKQDDQNKSKKICCGFTTARGEKVNVSQKNLQKAKILFKEVSDLGLTKAMQDADILFRDDEGWTLDSNSDASLEQTNKVSTKESGSLTGNLSQLKPDRKQTADFCEEPESGLNKANQKEGCSLPGQNGGFQTASGKTVIVSCEALSRAKLLSENNSTTLQFEATAPPLKNGGFHSVRGKPMTPSAEEVEKPKSLFNITRRAEVPDVLQTRKTDDKQDDQNKSKKTFCGFTTARGEKVNVSQKNLQKAKILFKEVSDLGLTKAMQDADISFRDDEGWILDGNSDASSEQTNKVSTKESGSITGNLSQLKPDRKQAAGICEEPESSSIKANQKEGCSMPGKNGGFQPASGNTVAISCEALLRPKLLSENKVDDDGICAPSQLSETPVSGPGLMNGGFFSASGKPVAISSEALQKAKALCSDISVTTALPYPTAQSKKEKMKCGLTNVGVTNVINSELSHVKYTEGTLNPISPPRSGNRKNHSAVQSFPLAADIGSDHEEKPCMIVCDLDIKNSIKRSEVLTTGPEFQSLNLAGCTETQQMIFAQEAFDCTKALLDDEVRIGQSLLMGSEHFQIPEDCKSNGKSTEEAKRKKTRSAEDLTAQPPSKRRLLEEFSETTDGPRGSGLHPIKSSPNGLMDRGVFKYNTSLHPHITKPHRDAKSFVQSRYQRTTDTNPGDHTSASSKMQAFVPPFIKSAKRAVSNNPEVGDRKRVPVFVPPFKKQRIVLQVSSPKQQGSDTNNDVTLTKKTPSSTDIVPLMKSSNTNVMIPSVPENEEPVGAAETSHVDNKLSRSQDRTENIMLARDMQDMRIRKKKRQTIRPLPGSLFLTKTSGVLRIPLKLAVNGNKPTRCSAKELYECGVHKHVPEITGANAESFRFNLLQFIKQEMITDGGGVQLADGGWLIPSNDWTAGKEEFYRALCDTPGVDPKLITEQWVYNHYRWIVWKQASMEKSFPEKMGSLCLTPEQILLQLKYRYDVEVDHSRRPALKKIMERDDTPAKTLILCVCEIVSRGHLLNAQSRSDTKTTQSAENNPSAIIWLTDGWYAIKAQLDEPLTAMLHKGRLAVGGKLMIHGAQLVGSQDACSPLEAPDSLMLKICANSTRRARWDAKLGFHKDPRPFLLPISCLFSNGGLVGCVDVLILRSYPMQWMERKSDGGVVFRSDRAEEKEARRFSHHKQKVMEMLFAKIQAEFEKEEEGRAKPQRRRQTISKQDVANLQEGVELYEAVGDDPAYLEAHLSKKQMETLQAYRSSLMEKKQAELQDRYRRALDAEDNEMSCPKRDVAPVWRLCIADSKDQSSCVYKLNLWRPSSDLQSLLKEGCRFKVYNLAVSDGKNRSTIETVQLTGTKKTQFQEMPASPEWLSSRFQPRVATDFADLQNEEFKPLCGEVDLVGYVISVIDQQGPSPAFYLVDGKQNFVKVRCFTSLAQAGLEDVVKPGVLLALSNLQLRGQSMYPTPVVYAGDLTAFSTNPKEIHLQESLQQLKSLVQCQDNFCPSAEEKLAQLVKSDGMQSVCSPSLQPQPAGSATDRRQSLSSNVTFQKPGKSLGSFTPVSSKLPAPTSSTEKDPKSLKRKRALDYLSRIPSPPPISPLGSVVSPCVKRTFNPPRRSGPPSTLKPAQTVEPKRADSLVEDEWVNDEELAMIDTQELHVGNLL